MADNTLLETSTSLSRSTREAVFQPPHKTQRRGYEFVSPTSPDAALSLASIRVLFEEYLDPVRSELDSIRGSLQTATSKLDEIAVLSERCTQLQAENMTLKSKLKQTQDKCQTLEDRLVSMETVSRRNNLKFVLMKKGKSVSWPDKDCESIILDMCNRYNLNLSENSIERAHKLRTAQRDSPIIARFLSFKDKLKVIRQKQKFRESGILVVEDFPVEVIQCRKMFSPVLTAAYRSNHKAHLSVDKLILDGKPYTVDDLDKLPQELQPNNLSTITKGGITAFYTLHSKLSNHYPCSFSIDGTAFQSVEQFFMFKKASLFGDDITAEKILKTPDPAAAKSLGKKIHNFNMDLWRNSRDDYMRTALHAKFTQNHELLDFLEKTGDATLVEASPHDNYWGAGLSLSDSQIWDPSKWRGLNFLGKMLRELRENIKQK